MLHTCRIALGFIGGFNLINHPEISIPIFIIGLLLCFVDDV